MASRLHKLFAYALIITMVTVGTARAVVTADASVRAAVQGVHSSNPQQEHHAHSKHVHDLTDVGTWACLKHCIEKAPDQSAMSSVILLVPSQYDLISIDDKEPSFSALDVANMGWRLTLPRAPPWVFAKQRHRGGNDIFLYTARLRI